MFSQFQEKINYSSIEQEVLEFWKKEDIFTKSLETRDSDKHWTFYEGPPTANGNPGIHHVLARAIKDAFCRYKTMQGYRVNRRAGWDTHGLPVEIALEKQLGLQQKGEIETKVGVAEFNRMAKELVYNNINREGGWRELTERMGYWVNFDEAYITCTNNYIESVWWSLAEQFKKGYIYRGFRITPQCPHCETPLSSHELAQGYKDVRDPSLYVKIKASDKNNILPEAAYFLVWTTTPWTLISNVAICVGAEIEYSVVFDKETNQHYVLASARKEVLDPENKWEVIKTISGAELEHIEYERLFSYVDVDKKAFFVTLGNFVSTTDGTGIVHIAPAFGADDYEISKKYDLPVINPVTPGGRFNELVRDFANRSVKKIEFDGHTNEGCDKDIIIMLKGKGLVLKSSNDYLHSYPHCWRCNNPIIYYARDSWYIRTTEFAKELISNNDNKINWQPAEIGTGRFGNWLKELKDWSLSRDRYWGTPLPIWVSEQDPNDMFCIGSIEDLLNGEFVREDGSLVSAREMASSLDLHKPFVDNIIFRKDGKTYRRTPELIDVWYDSGSMPFAQWHYPFENQDKFKQSFPADFIAEGVDQTRGWFYTLHAIATPLFGSSATKNILVNDLVLDDKGQKMSKSKGNVINPFEVISKYGADAVRWYMITSSPPWKPMMFSENDLQKTVISEFFRALTNTYSFFALYANIDSFSYSEPKIAIDKRTELDRWIVSAMNTMIKKYTEYMNDYDPTRAMRLVSEFAVENLSNWYVRRNRRRFWKSDMSEDKISAYQTLHECLVTVTKLMAPLAPFLSDKIYGMLNVNGLEPYSSVHLAYLPNFNEQEIDQDLERRMQRAQRSVGLARGLREKSKLKVRQPLRKMLIAVANQTEREDYMLVEEIIKEELNIKSIEYVGIEEQSGVVKKRAKANFKALGPKFGKEMKLIAELVAKMNAKDISDILINGKIVLNSGNSSFEIEKDDVEILHDDIEGWLIASEGTLTVALDTELDAELLSEGVAREFINRVQNLRKDAGFEVTDRIKIFYELDNETNQMLVRQGDYICMETLASEFNLQDNLGDNFSEIDLNGVNCKVRLEKI